MNRNVCERETEGETEITQQGLISFSLSPFLNSAKYL